MSDERNGIQKAIINLLTSKSHGVFYADLINQMVRIEDTKIPTAGVTVSNGRILLYWNPEFIASLSVTETIAVLEHECMHLVMDHLSRKQDRDHKMFNIAADLAINQFIEGLPKEAVSLDKFPPEWKLPIKASCETYYDIVNANSPKIEITVCDNSQSCKGKSCRDKNQQGQGQGQSPKGQQQQPGEGSGDGDDHKDGDGHGKVHVKVKDGKGNVVGEFDLDSPGSHEKWDEAEGSDITKEVVKQAVQQAVEASKRSQGSLPSGLEQAIDDLLKPPTVPWQTILRRFIAVSIKAGHKASWKRPNRRFGSDQKGKIPARQVAISIAIDTSGSISDDDLQAFISEIKSIQKCYKSDITVIECDAEIQKVYKLDRYKKVDTKFKGRGGTDFCPVFTHIKEKGLKTDVLIFFTDLCGTFPEQKPPYPVLWTVTPGYSYYGRSSELKVPFGTVLDMAEHDPKKKKNRY